MKFFIALIIVIAVLAFMLWRRGSTGLGASGYSDTEAGALGQGTHQQQGPSGGLNAS